MSLIPSFKNEYISFVCSQTTSKGGKNMDYPVVEVKNISLNYHDPDGDTKALKDISFSVHRGDFISIVGPSGCGKSTLLSIIANLLKPSKGEVLINGKPLSQSETTIGYMLQKDHLFEWRTIWQNVILGLEIQNKLTSEALSFAESLLEKYGLYDFKDKKPSQLSGGMRQRAALIRTLVLEPEVLILDEPFSALDYQTRLYVCDEIGTIIRKENKTAILVTHDISEAVSISDKVIVLSKRPAVISAVHDIEFASKVKSPMKAREEPEFRHYFNTIWKELDLNV
jgi:NitT/TauT family transport system ATP-binding protein